MGVVYNYKSDEPKIQVLHRLSVLHVDLKVPDNTEFEEGEWVGEDANGNAVKFTNGTTVASPKMVLTGTDRNDVKEGGVITAIYGKYRLKTKVYASGQGFAAKDKVCVLSDGSQAGTGKGVLAKVPGTAGTYLVVGEVVTPPTTDGDWMTVDIFADFKEEVVSG